ncbi:dioxygenase [Streptomyces sp. NPDC056161]|uniref:dioxygenase n=1 Tax=Streptomyces sp. NPDC056161 TaxID=3345732 RepID=UPI0035DFE34A
MAIDLTEETITAAVQGTFAGASDARLRELFVSLVQHLHDFARETRLTSEEWFTAVDFLERVGHLSSPTRQEFVLLSDILGLSVLVDRINHARGSATDSTLLGPFYVEGRPRVENGADISAASRACRCSSAVRSWTPKDGRWRVRAWTSGTATAKASTTYSRPTG